jgi:hypothetical protein
VTPSIPIQVLNAITRPQLWMPSISTGQRNFTLLGQSNVTYVIQQSPDLINWLSVATNYSPAPIRAVSLAAPDTWDFYRAVASP